MLQAKKDTTELQEKSKAIKKSIAAAEESAKELAEARDKAIMPIGNLVPDSVPVSNDEVSCGRYQRANCTHLGHVSLSACQGARADSASMSSSWSLVGRAPKARSVLSFRCPKQALKVTCAGR